MKREEEIIETAKFIYSPSSGIPQSLPMRVGFIEGAKWADETMIDKACEYLYEWNRKQVLKHGSRANISCSEYTISVYDFKKAMKGE